ncbi:hypothetical protein FA13DRAFT_1732068 [Coprinellus micaceus]|uniref:Symplekin/Pta1 N-terminal domain-containing protein n=1 Tax=Coprinellus micaceus TaxID=71717 RepID=A0A4Y7TC71_COPMI|nr:hypothetical protein FA13DRAFT_1732068 [Coprinellus micaceus]
MNGRTREASEALAKHIDIEGLIGLLLKASLTQRQKIIKLLESIMCAAARADANGGNMEHQVVEILHTQFYVFDTLDEGDGADGGKASGKRKAKAPKAVKWNTADASNAIDTFKALLMRRVMGALGEASIQAGVLGFLLHVATTPSVVDSSLVPSDTGAAPGYSPAAPTLSSIRVAAVSCLSEFYLAVVEQAIMPGGAYREEAQFNLQGEILGPLLDIVDDPDLAVSDKVVELLHNRFNDLDQAVSIHLWTHDGSMHKLVRKLALGSASGSGSAKDDVGNGKGKGGKGKSKNAYGEGPGSLVDTLNFASSLGSGSADGPGAERGPTGYCKATEMLAESLGYTLPQKPGYIPPVEGIPAKGEPATTGSRIEEVSTTVGVEQGPSGLVGLIREIDGKMSGEEVEMVDMNTNSGGDRMDTSAGELKEEQATEEAPDSAMMDGCAQGENKATRENLDKKTLDAKTMETTGTSASAGAKPPVAAILTIPAFPSLSGSLGLSDSFLAMLEKMNSRPKIEPLFNFLLTTNPDGVTEAFINFWLCETLEEGMREKLLKELSGMHGGVRVAAVTAGIPVPECKRAAEAESFSPFL